MILAILAVLALCCLFQGVVNSLQLRETISVVGQVGDSGNNTQQAAQYGQAPLLTLTTVWNYGTGTNANAPAQIYANDWFMGSFSTAATSYNNMNLYSGLTDYEGNVIAFSLIKRVMLTLAAPLGTNPLYIGPQNQTNGWSGWWEAITANFYDKVWWDFRQTNPWGITVGTSTNTVLPVYNPNATTQTYTVWILGDGAP